MTTQKHLTWYQKAFITAGITGIATIVVSICLAILSSAQPPKCKTDYKELHEMQLQQLETQGRFINRVEKVITVDSMILDKLCPKR